MITYTNRYNDKYTFHYNKRRNIQWSGDFKYVRTGFNSEDPDVKTMVDPSGGPCIFLGTDMERFDKSFKNKTVLGFIPNEEGYEIVVEKDEDQNQETQEE